MDEVTAIKDKRDFLDEKAAFLSHPESYRDATKVEVISTHMSLVFLTDRYVYKLKKPVFLDYLDFSTREARYRNCMEEVRINQRLGGDTYLGVLPIKYFHGQLRLKGRGTTVDWLVKMKRLPPEMMLDVAIKEGAVHDARLEEVAEKLVAFYRSSKPQYPDPQEYRGKILKDIEFNATELLNKKFNLDSSVIREISSSLFQFVGGNKGLFDVRIAEGRVIDAHGDLRPQHICLGPKAVIIDRLEFNPELRIMDIAEELSFFALECEQLGSGGIGGLFLNFYQSRTRDKIPDMLIIFYKAKRAFLRAKLSINHLLEEKYLAEGPKWIAKCEAYLKAAGLYCRQLPVTSGH